MLSLASMPVSVQMVAIGFAGLLAAAGPLLLIFGQLALSASALVGAFDSRQVHGGQSYFSCVNADTQTLFENCATDSDKYYDSPSGTELSRAFRAIAAELKKLRVTG